MIDVYKVCHDYQISIVSIVSLESANDIKYNYSFKCWNKARHFKLPVF